MKRGLSFLLALIMVLGMVPQITFQAAAAAGQQSSSTYTLRPDYYMTGRKYHFENPVKKI